jgi:hypothetical protein
VIPQEIVWSSAFRLLSWIVERRRLKVELQTVAGLISKFRAAPFVFLNVVCNEVELRDKSAARFILFGYGKTESQIRAPIYWPLAADNWPLITN